MKCKRGFIFLIILNSEYDNFERRRFKYKDFQLLIWYLQKREERRKYRDTCVRKKNVLHKLFISPPEAVWYVYEIYQKQT